MQFQALKDAAAKTLPAGYTYDWGDQSREELKAGSQTMLILGLGLTFVFLILCCICMNPGKFHLLYYSPYHLV